MERRDLAYTAYLNVDEFFASRKISRKTPAVSADEFSINMRSMGYIVILGVADARERLPERTTVFVIFSPSSESSRKKGGFKKVLDQIKMSLSKQKDFPASVDMIFISSEKPVSAVSGYDEILMELKSERSGIYIEAYTYEKIIITPNNSIVPAHRIMSQEEVNALNADRLTGDSRRPPIPSHDLPVVWLGGRPGDIIEIREPSGSTGYAIKHKVVK